MFALLFALALGASFEEQFEAFKTEYGITYESKEAEALRLNIFIDNLKRADELNRDPQDTAEYGVTRFMDLTTAEFSEKYLGYTPNNNVSASLPKWDGTTCLSCSRFPNLADIPAQVDWTKLGAVNPIKDQAQCGSCWAFSTVVGVEGAWFMAGNDLESLSEEEIVQCDYRTGDGNQGCQGGDMETAYQWVIKNGGLNSERAYPYTSGTGSTGTCSTSKSAKSVASIDGAYYVSKQGDVDEDLILNATAQIGPLSVGINAQHLQTYHRGVMNPSLCLPRLDHGVAIVGYGKDLDSEYWKVRNSWGKIWGEEGYFRIVRGQNKCGIADDVSVGFVTPSVQTSRTDQ